MKKIPKVWLGLIVVIVAVYLIGCDHLPKMRATSSGHPVKVRLKWSHHIQFAGFYVAKERGYYHENGLDVQLLPGVIGSGPESVEMPAMQMVASGEDDFGLTGPESILLARGKGVRVIALAAIFQQSPFCYIALRSEGIQNLRQLIGQPLGVHFDATDILTYRAMLKGARPSIRENEIDEVAVPLVDVTPLVGRYDSGSHAWVERKVKALPAYAINEPIDIKAKYGLDVTVINPAAYDVDLYGDTLFATEEMVQDHPKLVDCFVDATIRGWKDALDDPGFAVEATLRQDPSLDRGLESQKMARMADLIQKAEQSAGKNHKFGEMTYEKWKIVQRLVEERLGESRLDITKVFTNDHLTRELKPTCSGSF